MRLKSHASLALLSLYTSLVACSWTSDGGLTGRIESKREYSQESAVNSWDGEPIRIRNEHGTVQIVGVPGKTNISMHARFVAGANSDAEAEAAFDDMAENALRIERSDSGWSVTCGQASKWHEPVDPASTGCTTLRIEVPAGNLEAPLDLTARASYGGVHATGLVVKALDLEAPFGLAADVTPTEAANIRLFGNDLLSGLCSSFLRVPATTALAQVALSVDHPEARYVDVSDPEAPRWQNGVEIKGFDDAPNVPARTPSLTWSRGEAPFDVGRAEIHASLGKAVLTTEPIPAPEDFNQCEKYDPYEAKVSF